MKNKAKAFLHDEHGALTTQVALGVALALELIYVAVDWLAKIQ